VLFFSQGSTTAWFLTSGETVQQRDSLHRLQMAGSRTSCIFLAT